MAGKVDQHGILRAGSGKIPLKDLDDPVPGGLLIVEGNNLFKGIVLVEDRGHALGITNRIFQKIFGK